MKAGEIRELSSAELAEQLEAAYQEHFDLRFKLATRQLVNHRQVMLAKKNIARLKTVIREKELGLR